MPDLILMELGIHIAACRAVSRQQLGEHIPAAMDTHATIEVLLETVFSMVVYAEGL
jgi:alkylhydroperoxidase/carboxymuconolactone decarboxylase family protein YurZ